MSRQMRTLFDMSIVVVILGFAVYALQPQKIDHRASISMLTVGQGDSFLIQTASGAQVLIDGGRDAKVLTELAKVMPIGDRSIDVVIATHPDADHIGGLPIVLERYKVGLFLTSGVTTDTQIFKDLYHVIDEKSIPAYYVRRGMTLSLDPETKAVLTILFPDRDTSGWETNTASVVARLDIGKASALFTGDSPLSIEHYLLKKDPQSIDVDILKIGHHGSKTSSSAEFLKAVSPTLALISAGVNNRYGHPAPEVISRIESLNIPWISTQDAGTTTMTTDGNTWKIQSEK